MYHQLAKEKHRVGKSSIPYFVLRHRHRLKRKDNILIVYSIIDINIFCQSSLIETTGRFQYSPLSILQLILDHTDMIKHGP